MAGLKSFDSGWVRAFSAGLVALAAAVTIAACSAEDEVAEGPIGRVQQAQDGLPIPKPGEFRCECNRGQDTVDCGQVMGSCIAAFGFKCNASELPCDQVCVPEGPAASDLPEEMQDIDQAVACTGLVAGDEAPGLCAVESIFKDDDGKVLWRPTCCTTCVDQERPYKNNSLGLEFSSVLFCAATVNDSACGNAGIGERERALCKDCTEASNTCNTFTCNSKEGACDGSPNTGASCTSSSGAGKCSVRGICCGGCLDSSNECRTGTQSTACGDDGNVCANCVPSNVCQETLGCVNQACSSPTPVSCEEEDSNVCTVPQCSSPGGCSDTMPASDTTTCNDGQSCTVGDTCNGSGACVGTESCPDDGNPCTAEACGPDGSCVDTNVANGTSCTGPCGNETCQGGVCQSGTGVNCHDPGNPAESCKTTINCVADAASCLPSDVGNKPENDPCDDGNACTVGDTCDDSGNCVPGTTPLDCDDNDPCTVDSCAPAMGCVHDAPGANGTECADGDTCTINDQCTDGTCTGTQKDCTPVNDCQTAVGCTDGNCLFTNKADGEACEDETGECRGGVCEILDPGTGGTAGTGAGGDGAGGDGAGGDDAGGDGAGGAATAGASSGGAGGLFSGPVYEREVQGCQCALPGQSRGTDPRGPAGGLALVGLGLVLAFRRRRAG